MVNCSRAWCPVNRNLDLDVFFLWFRLSVDSNFLPYDISKKYVNVQNNVMKSNSLRRDFTKKAKVTYQENLFFFLENISLFVGPLIPLFWTSGDICPGFQSQGGSLACLCSIPQIHLWCDTCWLYSGQHGSRAFFYPHTCISWARARTWNNILSLFAQLHQHKWYKFQLSFQKRFSHKKYAVKYNSENTLKGELTFVFYLWCT